MDHHLDALSDALPQLWEGFQLTAFLTVVGGLCAFAVSVALGLLAGSTSLWARGPTRAIIEFFRGTSLLVQLFWLYYALPQLTDFSPNSLIVGIAALAMNYGAYGAEAVRSAITSVPSGQWEATVALSMSWPHKIRRIIFPQAWALMIPSLTNLLVHLLKGSAIVYLVQLNEFTFELNLLRRDTNTFFAYGLVGLVGYFVFALVLTQLMRLLEARAKHRLGRGPSLKEILSPAPKTVGTPGGGP